LSKVTTWRICAPQYAQAAYSGEGARLYGGRWNSRGRAVVYTSESISLAVLEQLVHVEDPAALDAFVVISATLDESMVKILSVAALPDDWRAYPAPAATKEIGDAWLTENRSLAMKVPSATVRGQYNFLINPGHPDFAGIQVSKPEALDLDPRITGQ
jgi:RES domain-containing protein